MALPINMGATEYIFHNKSATTDSDIYLVDKGTGLLLRAWGLGDDEPENSGEPRKSQFIKVISVAIDQKDVVRYNKMRQERVGDDGDFKVPQDYQPIAETCVMQCGMWNLNKLQNVGIISTPGFYRFEMSSTTMIGNVILAGTNLDGRDLFNIPTDLFFGCVS